MSGWTVSFLVIAAMAAFMGFGGVAAATAGAAQLVFYVAMILLAGTLLLPLLNRLGRPGANTNFVVVGFLLSAALLAWVKSNPHEVNVMLRHSGIVALDDVLAEAGVGGQGSE